MFVIDSSRSVRPFEFETMRQFLVGLLRSLDVGLNATRVGVIQYSSQVQSVFPLGAFSRREDMERAIRAVVPLAQGTMTGLAIQYAMNVAFSEAEGARPPEERVPRVLVIVTDGRPQDRVAEVAAQARARGIEIYAVGGAASRRGLSTRHGFAAAGPARLLGGVLRSHPGVWPAVPGPAVW